jgi:hypothetical protein
MQAAQGIFAGKRQIILYKVANYPGLGQVSPAVTFHKKAPCVAEYPGLDNQQAGDGRRGNAKRHEFFA